MLKLAICHWLQLSYASDSHTNSNSDDDTDNDSDADSYVLPDSRLSCRAFLFPNFLSDAECDYIVNYVSPERTGSIAR